MSSILKTKNFKNITKDKKQLFFNFLSLSVLQAFTFLLPLITLPYLVRVLGTEKFGLVMFAQAFIIFFNILVDFGFNLSATKSISINRHNKNKVTEIFSAIMINKIILLIISLFLLSIIVFSFEKFITDWELYYLTFLWVVGQTLFPIWYFQGIEKMKYITIINVISRLIFTILIFIVIKKESDYIYVPLLNGFGFIVGGVISLWITYKTFKQQFKFYNFYIIKHYFIESSHYFLSRISVTFYTTSNAFVLGLFTNNTMVGYYSIAEKLFQAIQHIYYPMVQALYPYVAKHKNISLFQKIFIFANIFNILGVVLLYFTEEYIFNLLFSTSIGIESLTVFNYLLLAVLLIVPSILLGYPYLGALGFSNYANLSVVYGSIFHIIGLIILIIFDKLNIYNVALMVFATESLVLATRIHWIRKNKLWQKQ
jgi:PST family polysaccharide transporter